MKDGYLIAWMIPVLFWTLNWVITDLYNGGFKELKLRFTGYGVISVGITAYVLSGFAALVWLLL